MIDEKTQAAVERLKSRDCGDSSCLFTTDRIGVRTNGGCRCFDVTRDRYDIITILTALAAANERAERECVWEDIPGSRWWTTCKSLIEYDGIANFCPNCGGKVKGAK